MINATEAATKELTTYFKDKEKSAIRVHLVDGGCSGPRLSLALDKAADNDEQVEVDGFTYLIDKALLSATGKVTIDMTPYGFTVESENPMGGGGCSCSSSGSCSSAGSGGCGC